MQQGALSKFNKLPEEVQDYLYSEELFNINSGVSDKYKFSEKQKDLFLGIVNQLFLKELSPDSLEGVLMNKLKIEDDKTVASLSKDIREKVLSPIKGYIRGIGEKEQKEEDWNDLIDKAIKKFNLFSSSAIPALPSVIPAKPALGHDRGAGIPTKRSAPSVIPAKAGISSKRPILEDIKHTPKLFGPVQEIAQMTLEDFRKLSGDPKESILKIKDKISLLREQSFKDYQAGISAWQKSPVYNEYLKILNNSLASGEPLEDILKTSKTLTQDEFNVIIEANIE